MIKSLSQSGENQSFRGERLLGVSSTLIWQKHIKTKQQQQQQQKKKKKSYGSNFCHHGTISSYIDDDTKLKLQLV